MPIELQVDLMRRVIRFERGFLGRTGDQVQLVVVRTADANSERVAGQLGKAIEEAKEIAGKPVRVSGHRYVSAAALKKAVSGAHIVYLAPGLEAELPAIAAALSGVPVITISTDGDQVDRGAVLGFELVSARPKIALNLGQARKQGLDFNSDLFRLARVVR